jgi:DHA2 family multidrug resistance protein
VAGIVNFMRNIGSSVGTSIVTTLTVRRAQFHQVHLVSRVAADNPMYQAQVNSLTRRLADAGLGTYEARRQALARIYRIVQNQAQTLAYIDTYWFLAVLAGVMFCLSFFLRKNVPGRGGEVAAG